MPLVLHAEAVIDAPVQVVWEVLTNLSEYTEWCPFTRRIEGTLAVGENLSESIEMTPGTAQFKNVVTVTEIAPLKHVTWTGRYASDCIVHAVRTQSVEQLEPGKTRFVTHEEQTGAMVCLVSCLYKTALIKGAANVANALKARAESKARAAGSLAMAV